MLRLRPDRPLKFFRTAPQPCPYLPGEVEQNLFTDLSAGHTGDVYAALSLVGFRRSHRVAYRPACPACRACLPVRVPATEFRPGRSFRRNLAANADLVETERPARATGEQFGLFARYVARRHGGGDMAAMGEDDYRLMIEDTPVDTRILEYRDGEGRLVAACLVDNLPDGPSAVYSFFEPTLRHRGLGTFAILRLLARARADSVPYVYLGYWVQSSAKMAYKARFRPMEIYDGQAWRPFGAAAPVAVTGAALAEI